jgi:hypothetical protein
MAMETDGCADRRWFSTIDPKALVTYTCSIEAGRDPQHPVFVVVPEDAPRETGHSATAAWWNIYKEGLRVRNQPEQAVMNGDEMFGLYDNVIKAMLQELPGADTLNPYIWRTFIEGGYVIFSTFPNLLDLSYLHQLSRA